jgi:RNase P subunit RPR2
MSEPTKRQSGRLDFIATAIDELHHGAGTSGNTSMLRVQEITNEDGEEVRVPFISGNSFKHMIRDAGVQHALAAMKVPEGTLSKAVVDLLFSGGHLTKKSASINLSRARQIADLFPILGICGYSAANYMAHSKMYVDNIHLVCSENAMRLPDAVRTTIHASCRAATFRGENFGTRHEASRSPHVARMLTGEERLRIEGQVSGALANKDAPKADDSSQMIYEFQVIKPGALLYGGLNYRDFNIIELAALKAALSQACLGKIDDSLIYHLGAKSSIGLGRVAVKWSGSIRGITAPEMANDTSLMPSESAQWDTVYTEHLQKHRDEILKALEEAAG